jgi:hypothetical protein
MSRSLPWTLVARSGAGAVLGAAAALIVGLIAVSLAPDNGFADLAAAAVTRVVLIPFGAVVGGITGYRSGR